jgi:hypothetical protein
LEGHLIVSDKELKRKGAFEMVSHGAWSLMDAASHLELSYRQCRRSYKRYQAEGDAGLVHKSRGRASNRAKDAGLRQRVLQLYDRRYEGFGPTLAAEKLDEEGYCVDHETLRRWLIEEGKWQRRRERSPYRKRRERREHFGELVQMDGSHHQWFGPDHPQACLINMIDDATSRKKSLMAEGETTEACMRTLWAWITQYGIPKALYTDKKNVFITDRQPTPDEQLAGEEPKTAFGKACAKLGIEIIAANSPQAKGRVERTHGVDQDRFIKELQLRGVTAIEGANKVLSSGYETRMNNKFAVLARSDKDYHRPVPKGLKLAHVFCFEEDRTVSNDWVVRYQNRALQISKNNQTLPKPGNKLTVQRLLDGTLRLLYKGEALEYRELATEEQKPARETPRQAPRAAAARAVSKPAPDHPWRTPWPHSQDTCDRHRATGQSS